MRGDILRTSCFAMLLLSVAAIASAQGRTCSDRSLAGAWGYTETGTVIATFKDDTSGSLPAAAVGRYDFDTTGNFSGTQYSSANGTVSEETKQGTYTVSSDCTGTLEINTYDSTGPVLKRSSVWAIVIDDNAMEIRGMMRSMQVFVPPVFKNAAPIMTLTAKRLFPGLRGDQQEDAVGRSRR